MPRDNPEGSSSRWLSGAGGPSPAFHVDGRKSSDDRHSCLENPRPAGAFRFSRPAFFCRSFFWALLHGRYGVPLFPNAASRRISLRIISAEKLLSSHLDALIGKVGTVLRGFRLAGRNDGYYLQIGSTICSKTSYITCPTPRLKTAPHLGCVSFLLR
jgi:hypothetical protein